MQDNGYQTQAIVLVVFMIAVYLGIFLTEITLDYQEQDHKESALTYFINESKTFDAELMNLCREFNIGKTYIPDKFDCKQFSYGFKAFANLEGYPVEIVTIRNKNWTTGHMLTSIENNGKTIYIEPQRCKVFTDYDDMFDYFSEVFLPPSP